MSSIAQSTYYIENQYSFPSAEEINKQLNENRDRFHTLESKIRRSTLSREKFISQLANKTLEHEKLVEIANLVSPLAKKGDDSSAVLNSITIRGKIFDDIAALAKLIHVEKSIVVQEKTTEKKGDVVDDGKKNDKPQKDESRCVVM